MKETVFKVLLLLFFVSVNIVAQDTLGNSANKMYVNTGDGLNMRTAPMTNSRKIRTLPIFTEVIILEKSNNIITIDGLSSAWYKIKVGNDIGWVFAGYLTYGNL
jgi:hypothetical protein